MRKFNLCLLYCAVLLILFAGANIYAKTYTEQDIKRLEAFADAGDPDAMNELGAVYYEGANKKERNIKLAVKYYEQAASLGYSRAEFNLSGVYLNNHRKYGITPDYDRAVKLARKSIERGIVNGYLNLGYAYNDGLGVPKNLKLAEKYYKIAAEANIPLAQFDLAYFYTYSLKKPDGKKSHYWFKKAALNGYVNAYSYLSLYYLYGFVFEKNLSKAYMFAKYGELAGAKGADNTLNKFILPKITPTEKAQGKKLLKEYIAEHPIPVKN